MANLFQKTQKDIAFEELIKELKPITAKSERLYFGTSSTAKGSTEHTLIFNYKEFTVKIELK